MEQTYEVYVGKDPVGKVQLFPQGLYVRVVCRCQMPTDQVYRLFAEAGDRRENLGVVVPEGDGFLLDKKIPAKRLGQGSLHFLLSCGGGEKQGTFIPICPEEPFLYIDRLKTAFLQSEHGKLGVRLEE